MRTIMILLLIAVSTSSYAQLPVTDGAANASLIKINTQMASFNTALKTLLKTSATNQTENYGTKISQEAQQKLLANTEEALWKVPNLIKNSVIVTGIFKRGAEIFSEIDALDSAYDNLGQSNSSVESLPRITDELYNLTAGILDMATDLITDDVFKATDSERIQTLDYLEKKLKEIETSVSRIQIDVARTKRGNEYRSQREETIAKYNKN